MELALGYFTAFWLVIVGWSLCFTLGILTDVVCNSSKTGIIFENAIISTVAVYLMVAFLWFRL